MSIFKISGERSFFWYEWAKLLIKFVFQIRKFQTVFS